jgi:hexokinase
MIPTYVFGWPTAKEKGDYLSVDLGMSALTCSISLALTVNLTGGTNLRVCLVTLQGEGKFEITQSKYRLTEERKQEDGQKLFDYCAECLKTFIDTNLGERDISLEPGQELPLGFTVCFEQCAAQR